MKSLLEREKSSTKIKFWGPEPFRWSGGLPREGSRRVHSLPDLSSGAQKVCDKRFWTPSLPKGLPLGRKTLHVEMDLVLVM